MKKYFNEETKYEGPTLLKFNEPKTIKLCELREFLESYKPFPCADTYLYEEFEYGDFDNRVEAIIESKSIDPSYSYIKDENRSYIKEGETEWSIMNHFWYYRENESFWLKPLQIGFEDPKRTKYITEIEIKVYGVYIISSSDKDKIEREVK